MTAPGSPPIALSMGDPAGVGAEIAVKAHAALRGRGPAFFCIADPDAIGAEAARLGARAVAIGSASETAAAFARGLPVLPEPLAAPPRPGAPDPANAPATIRAIRRAVALVMAGEAAAVVTNPISKKALRDGAGFAHPGHTEFLAELGGVDGAVMMLAAPGLRVVPVTVHVGLAAAVAALGPGLIERTIRVVAAALTRDFGVAAPRIAVAGLNPHAGEGGMMGTEEITIIAPALDRLRADGLAVAGPLAADTMFHPAARQTYDAAVCMYHDQALIPLKTLDFSRGVNVTLGLPFVRASPDHGVAYDIAGTGRADPTSLIEAIRLAAQLARNRARAPA